MCGHEHVQGREKTSREMLARCLQQSGRGRGCSPAKSCHLKIQLEVKLVSIEGAVTFISMTRGYLQTNMCNFTLESPFPTEADIFSLDQLVHHRLWTWMNQHLHSSSHHVA